MKIDEKTGVSVGVLVVIIGAVVWLVRLEGRVDGSESNNLKSSRALRIIPRIDRRLSRIEGKLGIFSQEDEPDGREEP